MKLRIHGNSLRLRLSRGEVDAIASGLPLEASVRFPGGGRLTYALAAADVPRAGASFDGGRVTVTVPRAFADGWAGREEVGMEASVPCGAGEVLTVRVEKDFKCIDRDSREDDADAFPHPAEGRAC